MLRFFVSNKKESLQFEHAAGPLEFGREPRDGHPRKVLNDPYVSADQLRLEELPQGKIRVTNLSKRVAVQLADGREVEVGGVREVALPVRLTIGQSLIEIRSGSDASVDAEALQTVNPPVHRTTFTRPLSLNPLSEAPDPEQLARWFETVVSVQRTAASSPEFYQEIARAVVEMIGLDYSMVLLRKGDGWETVARFATTDAPRMEYSHTVLDRVCREKRTYYQGTSGMQSSAQSLAGVTTVVASPVLDADGQTVIGAVFGAKVQRAISGSPDLRPLHAQLVQVLAAAAGAGIARVASEGEAARRHVQFEQFFSRELSLELDRNPDLLSGQDREVTILVSDIRGFSRIAEKLGPHETCNLMGDVLERLTARIHEHGGVVVDYVGDGILAMWNAPVLQADHAARACRAAMAMQGELPGLNERWGERIKTTVRLGIGINTGQALVGNTGSRQRLKYGPLGHTVNLASRVEGATKQLGVPVLITGGTHAKLNGAFATRRLCQVRVVGIESAHTLYELHGETATIEWLSARDAYESALACYEQGRLSEACQSLFPLLQGNGGKHDKPSLTLAARAIECLRSPPERFEPVLELESK